MDNHSDIVPLDIDSSQYFVRQNENLALLTRLSYLLHHHLYQADDLC